MTTARDDRQAADIGVSGVVVLYTSIMVLLKLAGVIDWSWYAVFGPAFWITMAVCAVVLGFVLVIVLLVVLVAMAAGFVQTWLWLRGPWRR